MRRLIAFSQITVDGYFAGPDGDMSWAHGSEPDEEWSAFVDDNAKGGGLLIFGRITYQMMETYWPTPQASQNNPVVAERMNALPKVVFSRTLEEASWSNTTLLKGELSAEVRRLKEESATDMAILGSGSIISQLAQEGLIDEYQIVVNPVALGKGRTIFEGLDGKLNLKLTKTRTFKNGNVVLWYEPADA